MNKRTQRKKRTYNFHRRKGEKYFRGHTTSQDENSITELTWKEAFFNTKHFFFMLLGFIKNRKTSLDTVITQNVFHFKTYIISFLVFTITGSLGPLLYLLTGGSKYFNNWYIALLPVLGTCICLGIIYTLKAVLHFFWNKHRFAVRKNLYIKYLLIPLICTPLAWLVYPIKHVFPAWEQHVFIVAFVITAYISIRVLLHNKSEFFRKRDCYIGILLTAVPYYTVFFYMHAISAFVVHLFKL